MQCVNARDNLVNHVAFSPPLPNSPIWLASAAVQEIILWSIPEGKPFARISFVCSGERIHGPRWALLDRLTRHCHVVETGNEYHRFRHNSATAKSRTND